MLEFQIRKYLWIVVLVVLVPFNIGEILNIPSLKLYEIIMPSYFLIFILSKLVSRNFFVKKIPLHIPIFLFSLLVIMQYLRNPLIPSNLLISNSTELSGFRWFYTSFLCILVYFLIIEILSGDKYKLIWLINFVFHLAVVMCFIGLIMCFLPFSLTGLNNMLACQSEKFNLRGISFFRIGFLGVFAQLGFISLLSFKIDISKLMKFFYSVLFIVAIVFSGGRTIFFSTIIVSLIWCIVKKKFLLVLIIILIILSIFVIFQYLKPLLPDQLKRFIIIDYSNDPRYYTYKFFLNEFIEHPLVGVGFGKVLDIKDIPNEYKYKDFILTQARSGGHGTYISLLYTMGLTGLLSYLWILTRSFFVVTRKYLHSKDKDLKNISFFLLLWISSEVINNFSGGMGWELSFYLILGFVGVVYITERIQRSKDA